MARTAAITCRRGRRAAAFYRYGCNVTGTGVGLYDLRKGAAEFPTDDELIAYIRHPRSRSRGEDADLGQGHRRQTTPLSRPKASCVPCRGRLDAALPGGYTHRRIPHPADDGGHIGGPQDLSQ